MKHHRWVIVYSPPHVIGDLPPEPKIYLRRKMDYWGDYRGWRDKNLPIMVFEEKREAEDFAAGLALTGGEGMDPKWFRIVKYG